MITHTILPILTVDQIAPWPPVEAFRDGLTLLAPVPRLKKEPQISRITPNRNKISEICVIRGFIRARDPSDERRATRGNLVIGYFAKPLPEDRCFLPLFVIAALRCICPAAERSKLLMGACLSA